MINRKEYQKNYREKNKNKLNEYFKQWYQKNKDKVIDKNKKHQQKNKLKYKEWFRKRYIDMLKSWEGFIQKKTNCQICGKEIYFNQKDRNTAIHFDHKKEDISIKISPTVWLAHHFRTPENEKIWDSCKFGTLCNSCNGFLPTKNRKQFIKNTIKYIFGNNAIIIEQNSN